MIRSCIYFCFLASISASSFSSCRGGRRPEEKKKRSGSGPERQRGPGQTGRDEPPGQPWLLGTARCRASRRRGRPCRRRRRPKPPSRPSRRQRAVGGQRQATRDERRREERQQRDRERHARQRRLRKRAARRGERTLLAMLRSSVESRFLWLCSLPSS